MVLPVSTGNPYMMNFNPNVQTVYYETNRK